MNIPKYGNGILIRYRDCLFLRILLDNLLLVQDYRLHIMTYLSNRKEWVITKKDVVLYNHLTQIGH